MLKAMFASVIMASARSMPIVRMNRPIRSFCSAKTCSTWARIFDFAALARAIAFGIALRDNAIAELVEKSDRHRTHATGSTGHQHITPVGRDACFFQG
jgi:hypothetical protein